jgi:pimeloyl-ACP methyl ester carboxylesterase
MKYLFKVIALLSSLPFICGDTTAQTPMANQLPDKYKKALTDYRNFEQAHGHYIQTPNVRLHYLTWGKPTNPAFIWAHGSLNSSYELLPIAEKLTKAGFYVIAIDYYGHGKTGFPVHETSLYHVADDIKLLMDKLNIKKASVGGFSRGGYIAAAFYDAYPASVLGLILEDGGSVASNTSYHKLNDEQLHAKARTFNVPANNPWDKTYDTEFEAYKAICDTADKGSQFHLFQIINKDKKGRWAIYPGMMKLFNLADSSQFMDLALRPTKIPLFAESMMMMEPKIIFRNLNVPVLILDPMSDTDPMPFEKENQALVAAHRRWIKYIVYPDTEHNIHYAHPEKFTADVISFLKQPPR